MSAYNDRYVLIYGPTGEACRLNGRPVVGSLVEIAEHVGEWTARAREQGEPLAWYTMANLRWLLGFGGFFQ